VYDNEFKIALRVGTRPYKYNLAAGQVYYDYHFMRQTDTGQWAEKHGYGGASILWDTGMTPDTIPWTLCGVPYYDSAIIYYALGN
jgi:peptidoglycan/xylan/chitin deacetylase (PgdA/CDA1 family)